MVDPGFEGAEGAEEVVERGIDEAEADDGEEHNEAGAHEVGGDLGADFIGPFGGHFAHAEAGLAERDDEIDVEGEVGDLQGGMDGAGGVSGEDFGRALGVLDIEPEQRLDDEVEDAAGEAAHPGLGLVEHGAGEPA